jgi:hypothetical protein
MRIWIGLLLLAISCFGIGCGEDDQKASNRDAQVGDSGEAIKGKDAGVGGKTAPQGSGGNVTTSSQGGSSGSAAGGVTGGSAGAPESAGASGSVADTSSAAGASGETQSAAGAGAGAGAAGSGEAGAEAAGSSGVAGTATGGAGGEGGSSDNGSLTTCPSGWECKENPLPGLPYVCIEKGQSAPPTCDFGLNVPGIGNEPNSGSGGNTGGDNGRRGPFGFAGMGGPGFPFGIADLGALTGCPKPANSTCFMTFEIATTGDDLVRRQGYCLRTCVPDL